MLVKLPQVSASLVLLFFLRGGMQANPDKALSVLDEVSRKYADARSYRIECIREARVSSELSSSWHKEILRAEQASEKRYRFEGQSASGSGLVISDGRTEWNFHRTYGQYTKKAPGSYGRELVRKAIEQDGEPEQQAFSLRSMLASVGDFAKSAHFLPEETVDIGDRRVRCVVVTYGPEDLRKPFPSARTTQTFWIDKEHRFVVKSLLVSDGNRFYDPARIPIHPIPVHTEESTIYPIVELNTAISEADFTFNPPENSVLVEDFSSPTLFGTPKLQEYDMKGKREPNLTLRAADNSTLQLVSLRGHPVLIDLWATWCGSCLSEMPLIDLVFKKEKDTGLVVLGLDYDQDPKSAVEFLRRKNYEWADYHADSNGPEFPHNGLPLLVLIDAAGKIVYYHNSSDDEKGLLSAIKGLGPSFAAAIGGTE